jgi:hypothetical protein
MDYSEFLENYSPELQLIDALDRLSSYSTVAAETVDRLVACSNNEKTSSLPHHLYQKEQSCAPDTQLL